MERWADRRARTALRQAVLRYVAHGWDVVPGAYLVAAPRKRPGRGARTAGKATLLCSCRRRECPAPGAHPVDVDWRDRASRDVDTVTWWWSGEPYGVVLPVGSAFEVFEAPAAVGECALRVWLGAGAPVGPVARTPDGRWLFFSAPGGMSFPELSASYGIRHRGPGDYILAPPTRLGGAGTVEWVRPPSGHNRRLSEALLVSRVLREASEVVLSTVPARPRRLRPALRLGVAHVR